MKRWVITASTTEAVEADTPEHAITTAFSQGVGWSYEATEVPPTEELNESRTGFFVVSLDGETAYAGPFDTWHEADEAADDLSPSFTEIEERTL